MNPTIARMHETLARLAELATPSADAVFDSWCAERPQTAAEMRDWLARFPVEHPSENPAPVVVPEPTTAGLEALCDEIGAITGRLHREIDELRARMDHAGIVRT
jgi:hypothetical protein